MPATLKSISSKKNMIRVAMDDDPEAITVWYTSRKFTPKQKERIDRLIADNASDEAVIIEQLLLLLVSWNLKADEDAKEPVSITRETLEDLPYDVLNAVMVAIQEDQTPKEPTDGSSNTP